MTEDDVAKELFQNVVRQMQEYAEMPKGKAEELGREAIAAADHGYFSSGEVARKALVLATSGSSVGALLERAPCRRHTGSDQSTCNCSQYELFCGIVFDRQDQPSSFLGVSLPPENQPKKEAHFRIRRLGVPGGRPGATEWFAAQINAQCTLEPHRRARVSTTHTR